MDLVRIILHVGILYIFYYIGVWLQQLLELAIPGSIIGMLLLLGCFYAKALRPDFIARGAQLLIGHMPLLFLPVTVGVINYLSLFIGKGIWLLVISLISTIIVMVSSGWVVQFLANRREQHE